MAQRGWICLHRKITECELWLSEEPFSIRDAWIDLLLMANRDAKSVVVGHKMIEVQAGERVTSQGHLAERWHWGRQKVRDYLNLLQNLKMISVNATNKYTIIKVLKYDVYQGFYGSEEPSNNHQITIKEPTENHQITTNNNNNNNNNIPTNVVVVSKDISKGGSYSPLNDLQYTLGWLPTEFQAQCFLELYQEVGEVAFHKALVKAGRANAKNIDYIEKAARGIANGDDYDEKPKVTGGYDIKKALAMADELERQHA